MDYMFVLSFDIPVDNFEIRRCQLSSRVRDRVCSPPSSWLISFMVSPLVWNSMPEYSILLG